MKRVYILLFTLLFAFSLNAGDYEPVVHLFSPDVMDISFKQTVQFNIKGDSKEQGIGFSTIAEFDKKELKWDVGANYSNTQMDFTTQVIYWPTFFRIINFGAGFTYHLYDYPQYFVEQDFLLDLYARVDLGKYFMIWTRWGGFAKVTAIKDLPVLGNGFNSMNFNLVLTWYPSPLWSCYFSFESNNYFNYPSFLTVFLTTGAEFEVLQNKFFADVDLGIKSYDSVVTMQVISQFNLKISGRYKL